MEKNDASLQFEQAVKGFIKTHLYTKNIISTRSTNGSCYIETHF